MTLTDAQIDRYSRQIVVPRIGGRGQEKLIAARMLLVGDARDIEAPLAYLVGAGIGTISIRATNNSDRVAEMISASRELNPDVSATVANSDGSVDLALAILGSEAAKVTDEIANDRDVRSLVIARLDPPEKIIVIPDTHRSRVAGESIGTESFPATGSPSHYGKGLGVRSSDFIAMLATAEAFKLLAGYAENLSPAIIEFDGYATTIRAYP